MREHARYYTRYNRLYELWYSDQLIDNLVCIYEFRQIVTRCNTRAAGFEVLARVRNMFKDVMLHLVITNGIQLQW